MDVHLGRSGLENPDNRHRGLLRTRRERPCCSGTANKCDEFPSPHCPHPSFGTSIVAGQIDRSKGVSRREWMSALGQKQTYAVQNRMSALPPIADMCSAIRHVCFGPKADMASYSRTSSARASTAGGTVRPRDFVVLRLITISYLVGACTGMSAGFSPLRMRST